MKPIKVYTYYRPVPGKPPTKSRISAYTVWASSDWPGCVVYEIVASSGADAKKNAIQLRLADEFAKFRATVRREVSP